MVESLHVEQQEWQAERPPYNWTGDVTREAPAPTKEMLLPVEAAVAAALRDVLPGMQNFRDRATRETADYANFADWQ
jgi:hypothetical protein